jgi:hypothetical protein
MPTRDFPAREGSESNAPAREASRGDPLLTPNEAARFMRVSESWLAKARMRATARCTCQSVVQFGISKAT